MENKFQVNTFSGVNADKAAREDDQAADPQNLKKYAQKMRSLVM